MEAVGLGAALFEWVQALVLLGKRCIPLRKGTSINPKCVISAQAGIQFLIGEIKWFIKLDSRLSGNDEG